MRTRPTTPLPALHSSFSQPLQTTPSTTTHAAAACTDTVTGYSSTFGKRKTAKLERWVNTTAAWKAKGRIGRLSVYYSAVAGCVQGVKPTFGAFC